MCPYEERSRYRHAQRDNREDAGATAVHTPRWRPGKEPPCDPWASDSSLQDEDTIPVA